MINMKALPPSWAALLSRIKIKLDYSAVIAAVPFATCCSPRSPSKISNLCIGPERPRSWETHFGVWRGCSRRTIQRQSRASERP